MLSSHRSSRTRATSARFRAAIFDHPSSPPPWVPLLGLTDCFLLPHTSSGTGKERKKDSKRTRFYRKVSTGSLHNLIPTANLPQSHPKSAPTNSFFSAQPPEYPLCVLAPPRLVCSKHIQSILLLLVVSVGRR